MTPPLTVPIVFALILAATDALSKDPLPSPANARSEHGSVAEEDAADGGDGQLALAEEVLVEAAEGGVVAEVVDQMVRLKLACAAFSSINFPDHLLELLQPEDDLGVHRAPVRLGAGCDVISQSRRQPKQILIRLAAFDCHPEPPRSALRRP